MIVNAIFTIIMLVLALIDIKTTKSANHKDFKGIILTIGVLGTFVGVFIGLLDFDISNIEDSIPFLLEGLKVAFYTSIAGMSISIVISIYQRFVGYKIESKDNLDFITLQTKKLDNLETLTLNSNATKEAVLALLESNEKLFGSLLQSQQKMLDSYALTSEKLLESNASFLQDMTKSITSINETLNTNDKNLAVKLNALQHSINAGLENLCKEWGAKLDTLHNLISNEILKQIQEVNFNISREIEKLASNFSSDVICGVNNLSETFSNTIHTHFSDNFKRFNKAVDNLLTWQIEYKKNILDSNEVLSKATLSLAKLSQITDSILKRDEKTIDLYKEVSGIMKEYKSQNIILDEKLSAIKDLGSGALEALKFMNTFFDELNSHLKSTNENVLSNLKKSNDSLIVSMKKSIQEVFLNTMKEFELSNQKIITEFNTRDSGICKQIKQSIKGIEDLGNLINTNNQILTQSYQKLNKDIEANTKSISKNTTEMISEINKEGIKHLKNTTKLYFDDISQAQYKILNNMSNQITTKQEMLDSTIITMATKYLESLEQISISSIEASKELNLISVENVRNLNDEITKYIKENANMMNNSNLELLNVLDILQKQVEIAMDRTNNMQTIAKDSITEIEESLQKTSESFKSDYEWFLRRIKEIIGQRLN